MRTHTRTLARGTFGIACTLALAFGAIQAVGPSSAEASVRACTSSTCGTACFQKGYTHWACWNGNCQCSYGPPI